MEAIGSKRGFKRFELPVKRFSQVALPAYLSQLDKHQSDINKLRGNREQLRLEMLKAERTVRQLQAAMEEIDAVREQLSPAEARDFDRIVEKDRKRALEALRVFSLNTQHVPEVDKSLEHQQEEAKQEQTFYEEEILPEEIELECRRAQLETWTNLQKDIGELHEMFVDFSQNVSTQATTVDSVEQHVETALEEVNHGEHYLALAAKSKRVLYPLTGALIGTCIAGPVGLLAGIKIGGLAAIGGTILGFAGGKALKNKEEETETLHSGLQPRSESCAELCRPPASTSLTRTTSLS